MQNIKYGIFAFIGCLLAAACASKQTQYSTPRPNHPIIGAWKFVLPNSPCFEVYSFKADGKRAFTSGEEAGESSYEISDEPSSNGFYKLRDSVTESNGKSDCSGNKDSIGDTATVYVQFRPGEQEFIMCRDQAAHHCFGPFFHSHDNSSEITDPEIDEYKSRLRKGCADDGVRHGAGLPRAAPVCDCLMNMLDSSLTHENWQEAVFANQNRRTEDEGMVLRPVLRRAGFCRIP